MAARSETTCPGFTAKAAALVVTTSAKRPPAAVIPAATMEASASATVKAASTAAMKASASAAVETPAATATMKASTSAAVETPATTTAMKTTSATAVAAAALRKDWIRRESKTGESSKCDEESETESACHLYLPWEVGVQFRTRKLCTRTSCSYLIRFYPYTMGCTDAK